MKRIAILATLDTKGEEAEFLKKLILERGHQPIVVDIGSDGNPMISADISADEVARAAGVTIDELRASKDRLMITELMTKGGVVKLKELVKAEELDGILAIGGISGMVLGSSIMNELPFNLPKLVVSTAASIPGSNRIFGPSGITLMHSLFDVAGLNPFLKAQLSRAAGAICGMVEEEVSFLPLSSEKPMIAISTYGYTENCAQQLVKDLKERYEPVRFHAVGVPEIAMEKLIDEGYFQGIIDLVPSSITNAFYGGSRVSWPERMEVAGEKGLPQVVAPGGINTFTWTGIRVADTLSELKHRKHYYMDPQRVTIWLNEEELRRMAPVYAEKLNKAKGPTKFIVPLKGWLSIEREETSFFDPQVNKVFVEELKRNLKPEIEVREVDANIDDPSFAQTVFQAFEEVMETKNRRSLT
ncbi:MAG: Tm-1-like ATP-binding domain-containing protein [Thermodesulfobacteriota bacterium]